MVFGFSIPPFRKMREGLGRPPKRARRTLSDIEGTRKSKSPLKRSLNGAPSCHPPGLENGSEDQASRGWSVPGWNGPSVPRVEWSEGGTVRGCPILKSRGRVGMLRHFRSNSYITLPPAVATFSDSLCPSTGMRTWASAIARSPGRRISTSFANALQNGNLSGPYPFATARKDEPRHILPYSPKDCDALCIRHEKLRTCEEFKWNLQLR